MTKTIDDEFKFDLPNVSENYFEELENVIPNFNELNKADIKHCLKTVKQQNIFTKKKTSQYKQLRKQQKKDIFLQLENFEHVDIDKDKVLNGFLLPHEKDMILNDLEMTNFKLSYEQMSLNYMPAIPLEQKDIEKVSTLIDLRNKEFYLDFELYHSRSRGDDTPLQLAA